MRKTRTFSNIQGKKVTQIKKTQYIYIKSTIYIKEEEEEEEEEEEKIK